MFFDMDLPADRIYSCATDQRRESIVSRDDANFPLEIDRIFETHFDVIQE
jgi:hypothetical protein